MSEGGSGEGGRKVGGAVQKVGQRWRRHCVTLGRSVDREALQPRESKGSMSERENGERGWEEVEGQPVSFSSRVAPEFGIYFGMTKVVLI